MADQASPYEERVHEAAITFLEAAAVKVVASSLPDRPLTTQEQGELALADAVALARQANVGDAETVVLSCTDMRAIELVEILGRSG
jgi:maleate isomerase